MRKKIKPIAIISIFFTIIYLEGCGAARITGEIFRGNSKQFQAVLTPGITSQDVNLLNNICIAINGLTTTNQTLNYTSGTSNQSLFSDLFSMSFIQKGYNVVPLVDEETKDIAQTQSSKLDSLYGLGYNLVIIGNVNLMVSSTEFEGLTGAEYSKLGVNGFTMKGIRLPDKKIVFLSSGKYGKAQPSDDVASDAAFVFDKIVQNKIKDLNKEEN